MCETAIRQLAVCGERSLIAAALFESTVQIWSYDGAQERGQFESILDFGGLRLTFAANGSVCVAGCGSAELQPTLCLTECYFGNVKTSCMYKRSLEVGQASSSIAASKKDHLQ